MGVGGLPHELSMAPSERLPSERAMRLKSFVRPKPNEAIAVRMVHHKTPLLKRVEMGLEGKIFSISGAFGRRGPFGIVLCRTRPFTVLLFATLFIPVLAFGIRYSDVIGGIPVVHRAVWDDFSV